MPESTLAALESGIGSIGPLQGNLATAVGLAASGARAAVSLTGRDLIASYDLLHEAARRRLPLLVHLAGPRLYDAYHAAASTGAVLFFATDAQDAVDLALLGRRVAEQALVPVVVAADAPAVEVRLPSPEEVRRFLGCPGDQVHPPTPGQEALFGKHRHRVPRWHDPERPILHGAVLGPRESLLATASRRVFFDSHLEPLLIESAELFSSVIGRRPEALRTHGVKRARFLLVTEGAAVETAEAVAKALRSDGIRLGVLGLRALRPFPAADLIGLLEGRRGVVVLERLEVHGLGEAPLVTEIRSHLAGEKKMPRLASVLCGADLEAADLTALVRRMTARGTSWDDTAWHSPLFLGFSSSDDSEYPKRKALEDALRRGYPELGQLGIRGAEHEGGATSPPRLPTQVVRRLGRSQSPVGDLPAFWGHTGVFYHDGRQRCLTPDPFVGTGTVAPISSALLRKSDVSDVSDLSEASDPPGSTAMFPELDPSLCNGCGACWSVCPDGAFSPVALTPAALIDEGMKRAQARGRSVDKLRMVSAKLAARVTKELDGRWPGGEAGPLFDAAMAAVLGKMKLPKERKEAVREAWQAVLEEIAGLPVAGTAPFDGLFSLAVDPDVCKGCGLCVAACEPRALTPIELDDGQAETARRTWRICEELPPPDDAVLEAVRRHEDAGPLAGALLSREARDVMVGPHGAEPGSGTALALRQVLGTALFHLRGARRRQLEEIRELQDRLAREIHDGLAHALPDRDLDALARGLDALHQDDAELAELTSRVETAFDNERVDVGRTRRLVDAARALADLEWRLKTGTGGSGRAPASLVLAGDELAWAATFPRNPFRLPVTFDATGDTVRLALGLAEGLLRETVDGARVTRRARLELDRPKEAVRADDELAELAWEDLDETERGSCPPVFLVMTETAYSRQTLAALDALDESLLPVKLVLLDETAGQVLYRPKAAVFAQSCVGRFSQLERAMAELLETDGAAMLRVLAPSPSRGGFSSDATIERARDLVADGTFPLINSGSDSDSDVGQALPADAEAGRACPTREDTELEQLHMAEVAALRREYETRLVSERNRFKTRMAQQIRGRLMKLATRPIAPREEVRP